VRTTAATAKPMPTNVAADRVLARIANASRDGSSEAP
jgi:hypothetical protein